MSYKNNPSADAAHTASSATANQPAAGISKPAVPPLQKVTVGNLPEVASAVQPYEGSAPAMKAFSLPAGDKHAKPGVPGTNPAQLKQEDWQVMQQKQGRAEATLQRQTGAGAPVMQLLKGKLKKRWR